MRLLLYTGLAAFGLATLALWSEAQQVDGRIEELTLSLRQKPDGQVCGVLNNVSKGRVTVYVSPFSIKALKGDTWAMLQPEALSCGVIEGQKYDVNPGRQVEFRVDGWMDSLKDGDRIRASVSARSGFNAGDVVSNPILFSKTAWNRQFSALAPGSSRLPAMAPPPLPDRR